MIETNPPDEDNTTGYDDSLPDDSPGTELAAPFSRQELSALLAPFEIDMRAWIRGIMNLDEFQELSTDEMTLGMLAQILGAASSEEALAAFNLDRARDMCGNEPGGKSPVLEIYRARPLKSSYDEGAACYVIVSATRLDSCERIQFTTGAKAVQTMIWKHAYEGWMPFKAMLEIRKERTAAGYYPLNLAAGI